MRDIRKISQIGRKKRGFLLQVQGRERPTALIRSFHRGRCWGVRGHRLSMSNQRRVSTTTARKAEEGARGGAIKGEKKASAARVGALFLSDSL